ncbi:hypothetical protein CG724_06880 [Streptomyces sp. CB02120-2]|nr:hypothetical protein CG724_06880 [Streptomyces sp. CB02120-2]
MTLLVLSCAASGCTGEEPRERGRASLTSADLEDAVLAGEHSGFEVIPQREPLLEDMDVVTAAEPSCQPLADLRSARPEHQPTGTTWAALRSGHGPGGASIVLTSLAQGEAKAWMTELKAAVTACEDYSIASQRGWSDRAALVALPSVDVGDESLSFSATSHHTPGESQVTTIVRTGGSLAVYLTPPRGKQLPASLMKQQHEKLAAAGD